MGTIQSFVDYYFAVPYYVTKMKKKIYRINNEVYEEKISEFSTTFFNGFSRQEQNNAKSYIRVNDLFKKYRFTHIEDRVVLTDKYYGKILEIKKPIGNTRPQNYRDWSEPEKEKVKQWLIKYKKQIMCKGYLSYDDAYFLAFEYLRVFVKIKILLQNRFSFVFVDEMQDMDRHQHDFLEKIFFGEGDNNSVYQRIGDRNQAIFDGEVKLEEIWVQRANKLEFNGSNRLTPQNAEIVKYFGLQFVEVEGRNKNSDGSEIDIKPHMIVFNDANVNKVIEQFADLIKKFQNENKIPLNSNYSFKAICWRKEVDGDGKIALTNYFDFKLEKHKPKIDYICLSDYIKNCKVSSNEFREIRKNIINALLKILRLEEVQSADGRNFTESKLILFIKEKSKLTDLYEFFMKKIFLWSKGIIQGKHEDVIVQIKTYLQEFLLLFGKTINKSRNFIDSVSTFTEPTTVSFDDQINVYKKDKIQIEITTVHAAKGQTHTATIYLESYYRQGYESDRLNECFKGRAHSFSRNKGTDVYKKESIRMAYVGLSRPTHLLCFAVHKIRFDTHLSDIDRNKWEVIELL